MIIMFAALPRYLSQLLAGQEPTQLSQGSAAKVLEMMEKVHLLASHSLDRTKLYHHLSQNMTLYLQPWHKKVRKGRPVLCCTDNMQKEVTIMYQMRD